jgi:hypothetical protein
MVHFHKLTAKVDAVALRSRACDRPITYVCLFEVCVFIFPSLGKQIDKLNNNNFFGDGKDCPPSESPRWSFTAEHKDDFERISIECVKTLMNSGKCCVIVVPPQVKSISVVPNVS